MNILDRKWHIRFLELAQLIANWSKDPSTKVGAVIVNPNTKKILSTGFNGFPSGHDDNPELYADRAYKYANVVHAEENALINNRFTFTGCLIYTSFHPCPDCIKLIHESGISEVVTVVFNASEKPDWIDRIIESKRLAIELGVRITEVYV